MSQIYNKMRIDVKEEITDIITAKQDDSNSRFLDVYLYDGATPIDLTGEEVRIYMRKPDGTEIFNNGTITEAASGRCQFELTSQALGAVGVLKCEISIWQGNTEILTTQTFHVFVAESLRSNGSIESSNEYGALVVLFQNLYQSIDLMQDMVANFGTPSGSVDADTFWQMLEKLYEVNADALANASVQGVLDVIGETGDTGGSATAGTVMAKINHIIKRDNENHGFKEITTAGTTSWTCPEGVYMVYVTAQGGQGGGGGGGGTSYELSGSKQYVYVGGGGGSGGLSPIITAILPVIPGQTYSITVGAGGTEGTGGTAGVGNAGGTTSAATAGSAGGNGGQTKFGSLLTVNGGNGGKGGAASKSIDTGSGAGSAGSINALFGKAIKLFVTLGIAGADGKQNGSVYTPSMSSDYNYDSFAGGAAKTSETGLKSGAGGKSGGVKDSVCQNGSAGGKGQQGYIKFIW